jgi:hypothetical protein
MIGCGGTPVQHELTIASTPGGSVTTPGEGVFTYDRETAVDLAAEAEEGYRFAAWTGMVGRIADVNSPITTISMYADFTITASFYDPGIRDWYDLDAVRDNLNFDFTLMNDLNSTTPGYAELASVIANGGKGWEPIGTFDNRFTGTIDGQGYEIRDLFIERPDEGYVGLFSCVGDGGLIRSTRVTNFTATGNNYVGGLIGYSSGTVTDCHAMGCVYGDGIIGGLVGGLDDGTVRDSCSIATVTGLENVGGLIGHNYNGMVGSSYSAGNVTGNDYNIGGLVGSNSGDGTVHNSCSNSNVIGFLYTGGLVGYNGGGSTISNSYSTGNVTGDDDNIGGLVGYNGSASIVANSFWDIETSGQTNSAGGTGKTTAEMQNITTFSGAGWDIVAVADPDMRNVSYIWNIVDDVTYAFLSWEPVS